MPCVNDVVNAVEKIAKPEYAYEWDNCGLLAGDRNENVSSILISLDITREVVQEAIKNNCQMIISHHPLIFKAVKNLCTDNYEGEILSLLYKNNIALYCAHTSLDACEGGVNDSLCDILELEDVSVPQERIVNGKNISCSRIGKLPQKFEKNELLEYIKDKTGSKNLLYYLEDKAYNSIGLCSGAGEEYAFELESVDVFFTGEVKYHTALELKRQNISFIAAGHYYTEVQMINSLASSLQKSFNMLKYNIEIIKSETNTNPFENLEDIYDRADQKIIRVSGGGQQG